MNKTITLLAMVISTFASANETASKIRVIEHNGTYVVSEEEGISKSLEINSRAVFLAQYDKRFSELKVASSPSYVRGTNAGYWIVGMSYQNEGKVWLKDHSMKERCGNEKSEKDFQKLVEKTTNDPSVIAWSMGKSYNWKSETYCQLKYTKAELAE